MLVPVVSSGFASFSSLFGELGANTLGWLFIDQAGQAPPQAAVGALWRFRRALVLGDPLQVEPPFSAPIKLIETLARGSQLPLGQETAPHRVSVQNLADAANPLGAQIGSGYETQWIGSPLRVQRGRAEPMFSIANEIAYAGKMIGFDPNDPHKRTPPQDGLDLGASAWVDAPGAAEGKNRQVVAAQIELVQQALMKLYRRTGELPPLYIITPFKNIKAELLARVGKLENWSAALPEGMEPPKKSKLQQWCKTRIGAVHGFQGRQESIVWMLLGCDEQGGAAARWVASKPNVLTVALTRARHRFFMIGAAQVWDGLPYFMAADAERLPRISTEEFLRRMDGAAK
jgi:hypothetical protein